MATTTVSEVRICNMALSNVGASSTIESLDELNAQAKICDLWYDFSRRQTLAIYDWNFARKRQILATHTDAPPDTWKFRYQYPVDSVKLRLLENPAGRVTDAVPFEIESSGETKSILTNLEEATAVYTFNLTSTPLFSEMFVEMFAFALASKICFSLTSDLQLRDKMVDAFVRMARVAPAVNANERVGENPRDADWMRGRV